jgi:tetratricopeptide (TPR) repeat protein
MAGTPESISSQLLRAFSLHQKGSYGEAEKLYRDILLIDIKHFEAKQLLGALLVQTKRPEEAIPLLEELLARNPNAPQVHVNLGTAYSRIGRPDKASECYQKALALNPADIDARSNLASSLIKQKRFEEAIESLKICLQSKPDDVSWTLSLASCWNKLKKPEEAKDCYERILLRNPDHTYAIAGLGQILLKQPKSGARAAECWQRLIDQDGTNPAYFNNLASALKSLERFEEAEVACRRAIELLPDFFQAIFNLGLILCSRGRFEESRHWLLKATEFEHKRFEPVVTANPAHAEYAKIDEALWNEFGSMAFNQLAVVENALGNTNDAWKNLKKCLEIRPDYSDAELMQAFLHLQVGDFEKGWPLYEARLRGSFAPRSFGIPRWDGRPAPDATLLVHAEQGLGDSIMFIRYAALAKARVKRLVFLSHKPITRLMRSCVDIDEVIPDGEPLPQFDFHIPLMSLPGVFGTTFETVPRDVPYLHIPEELIASWRERMARIDGFRIGIGWQGNPEFANDQFRRVPLQCFKVLAEIPGVQLISLQQGHGTEQLSEVDFPVHVLEDVDKQGGAFMDTGAIMKNLDLVISSCTATPHLAGALGVPVWLAKSFVCEWRWMSLDCSDNAWYPTMKMFRQPVIGEWSPVFERMRLQIEKILNRAAV